MDVLVDVVHPIRRDQMVLSRRPWGRFLVSLIWLEPSMMIHGSDVLAVGTQDFHVFLDIAFD